MTRRTAGIAASLIALAGLTAPAQADIYGCWTHGEEMIEIQPWVVITPGDQTPSARVTRHGLAYIAPEGERDAGRRIEFRELVSGDAARHVRDPRSGDVIGSHEIWSRCAPPETRDESS